MRKEQFLIFSRIIAVLLLLSVVAAGCKTSVEEEETTAQTGRIYYLSQDGYSFTSVPYEIEKNGDLTVLAQEMLRKMKDNPSDCLSAIPEKVEILHVDLSEETLLISMSKEYQTLSTVDLNLCNAGIVFTLSQLEGVSGIGFAVEGVAIMDADGMLLTYTASDFSSSSEEVMELYNVETVTLYLTDSEGQSLSAVSYDAAFPNNISMEKYIVEQLIGWEDGEYVSPIPDGTSVVSIATKDAICYVNFNSAFLNEEVGIDTGVKLYSVVNSLTTLSYVNFVQISIDGSSDVTMGDFSFSSYLSSNWNYLKTQE